MKPHHLITALLLALAAPAAVHAEPTPPPAVAPDARHAQDLREMITLGSMLQWLQAPPSDLATLGAPEREFDAAFRRQMTQAEVHRRMVPVYAALFSPKQAAELAKLMRNPAWRKREDKLQSLNGRSIYLETFMTPAEIAETRRVDAVPAMRTMRYGQSQRIEMVRVATQRWAREFDDGLGARAAAVISKVNSDLAAGRESGSGNTITIGRVGVGYLDRMLWILGDARIKTDNAYRRFDNDLKARGHADILKAQYLASAVSLAHSQTVVEQSFVALETLLATVDGVIKEREEALRKVEFPRVASARKRIEDMTGGDYAYMVSYGEAYRRYLDDQRRLLAFVAGRQNAVKFEDGMLLFSSDQDLAMVRELHDKLDVSIAAVNALVFDSKERQKAQARKQNGEPGQADEPSPAGEAGTTEG